MKYRPRLYKSQGIWRCAGHGRVGLGFEPADAYADWKRLVREMQRRQLGEPVAAADSAAQL